MSYYGDMIFMAVYTAVGLWCWRTNSKFNAATTKEIVEEKEDEQN